MWTVRLLILLSCEETQVNQAMCSALDINGVLHWQEKFGKDLELSFASEIG